MGDHATDLYVALVRLVRGLRRDAPAGSVAAGGLSALFTLARSGPLRATVLAEVEGVSAASMTRIVDRLCEDGLTERSPDPADGRAQLVDLTAAGRSLVEEGRAARVEALRRRIEALGSEDRQRLDDAIEVLRGLGVS
ncbi:MarR family winged helix-turn-helix transcriptional regulator [Nocardioides sp. MH1]|uniref:MarR family winged helix-turn-helix transcriptional regulator n=1 Tax=Nocardioides sp. MH1 TaxID=3242490 RepID=UPI0035210481